MDSETNDQQEQQRIAEAQKLQEGMFLRYHPQAGRADRMASNIPGGHTSSFGGNADHMIGGRGGSNN